MKVNNPVVAVVVVTYNRSKLLLQLLDSIKSLTYKNIRVVIVNNASTDDTAQILKAYANVEDYYVIQNTKNTGGAGGFKIGMEFAHQTLQADWQFLVDDDVVIYPDAIETLLEFSGISECIHGSKEKIDGTRFEWEGHYDTTTGWLTWYKDRFVQYKSYTFVNYACFEGMFISKRIINKIGYPDERYFIWMDDHMYGLLASRHTNVAYVSKFTLKKTLPVGAPGAKALQPYFQIRNYFLMWPTIHKYFPEARWYFYFPLWTLIFFRKMVLALVSLNFFRVSLLMKAVFDGYRKKFGPLHD